MPLSLEEHSLQGTKSHLGLRSLFSGTKFLIFFTLSLLEFAFILIVEDSTQFVLFFSRLQLYQPVSRDGKATSR